MKNSGPALYIGVHLIVALILAVNIVIFVLVMRRLINRTSASAHMTDMSREGQNDAWRRVQNAVAVSSLLGLTWIFGFLAIGEAKPLINVLFVVFNSLQGLVIFVMFCVRQKDVRDKWSEWLHCRTHSYQPGGQGHLDVAGFDAFAFKKARMSDKTLGMFDNPSFATSESVQTDPTSAAQSSTQITNLTLTDQVSS